MTKAYALDLAERVGTAFVLGAGGSVATVWAGPAFGAGQLTDLSAWSKIGTSATVAGLAAVGSLVKGLIAGRKTGTASLSRTVAETAVASTGQVITAQTGDTTHA